MVAVLFDLDGVLLDSERIIKTIWEQLLPHSQNKLWEQCLGVNQELELKTFQSTLGWSADRYFHFLQEVKQHLPSTFSLRPGVTKVLKTLHDTGCLIAIVTSRQISELPYLMSDSDWVGLINSVDCLVTGDTGLSSKPDPAPYLFAMTQLSVHPNNCVVIEDAPNGVRSAISAGAYVIALEDTVKHDSTYYKKSVLILEASLINDVEQILYENFPSLFN